MGDVALCVPVLLAFKRDFPSVELVTLSRKHTNYILQQITGITVLEARLQDDHKGITGIFKLARALRKHNLTTIADLHNVLRTKMLRFFMAGTRAKTIDKGRTQKNRLVNDPTFFEQLPHTTTRYAAVFSKLGYDITLQGNEFLPQIPLHTNHLKITGAKTTKWLGLAPFAAHATKSLTLTRTKELLQEVCKLKNVHILLFGGGPKEIALLDDLASISSNVVSVAGKTGFKNELAIISNLDCMIAMDSGNGHLAAMYGVPTVTIWGNTHPFAGFAPYAQPQENQFTTNREIYPLVPTSVYGNKIIAGYENVTDAFKMQQVLDRVDAILNKN